MAIQGHTIRECNNVISNYPKMEISTDQDVIQSFNPSDLNFELNLYVETVLTKGFHDVYKTVQVRLNQINLWYNDLGCRHVPSEMIATIWVNREGLYHYLCAHVSKWLHIWKQIRSGFTLFFYTKGVHKLLPVPFFFFHVVILFSGQASSGLL